MELAKPQELGNLKLSEPASINIGGLKKVTIRKEDGKPLVIPTGKCFSYGVKKDSKYKSVSMSLVLDDVTVRAFEEICSSAKSTSGVRSRNFCITETTGSSRFTPSSKWPRGNPLEVLQGQGGDRPHDLRGEALRGEGDARDRGCDHQRG